MISYIQQLLSEMHISSLWRKVFTLQALDKIFNFSQRSKIRFPFNHLYLMFALNCKHTFENVYGKAFNISNFRHIKFIHFNVVVFKTENPKSQQKALCT